jgi:hypothetical protein
MLVMGFIRSQDRRQRRDSDNSGRSTWPLAKMARRVGKEWCVTWREGRCVTRWMEKSKARSTSSCKHTQLALVIIPTG